MSFPDPSEPDPLDELLRVQRPEGARPIGPELLARTKLLVGRRKTVRRLGMVAALAVCYLAGAATVWGWRGPPAQPDGSVVRQTDVPGQGPNESIGVLSRRPQTPRPKARSRSTPQLARAGFDEIRRLSDRYLYEEGDILAALRYGVRALDRATPEESEISVERDSWLLMALKEARKRENQNDRGGT